MHGPHGGYPRWDDAGNASGGVGRCFPASWLGIIAEKRQKAKGNDRMTGWQDEGDGSGLLAAQGLDAGEFDAVLLEIWMVEGFADSDCDL